MNNREPIPVPDDATVEEIIASLNLEIYGENPEKEPQRPLPRAVTHEPPPRRRRHRPESKEDDEWKDYVDDKSVRWHKTVLQYTHDLLYLLAILIVSSLLLRVVVVSGTSMTNTLQNGDYLLVLSNIFYKDPQPGDIIVASKDSFDDGAPIIKRVIATEGQEVDIDFKQGIVYVDGVALEEPYVRTLTTLQEGVKFPLIVDEGCIFVLGDNRNGSKDSRNPEIGQLDKREVLGKAIFLFLPGKSVGSNQREFDRIGLVN